MKLFLVNIYIASIMLIATACQAQKLMNDISEAPKLQTNEKNFIGKPLKELLNQIGPEIKFVIGEPEAISQEQPPYLTFFFVTKAKYKERYGRNDDPIKVRVIFEQSLEKKRKALPDGGLETWGKEQLLEYGDMIVLRVRVSGKN